MLAIYALLSLFAADPEIASRRHVDPMLLNRSDVLWGSPNKEIVPVFLPQSVLETILPANPGSSAFLAATERLGLSAPDASDLREKLLAATASSPQECGGPIYGDLPSGSPPPLSFEQRVRNSEIAAVGEVVELVPGWLPNPTGGHVGTLIRVRVSRSLGPGPTHRDPPLNITILQSHGSLTVKRRVLCTLGSTIWEPAVGDGVLIVGTRELGSPNHVWGNVYPVRNDSVSPGDVNPNEDQRRVSILELERKLRFVAGLDQRGPGGGCFTRLAYDVIFVRE